MTEQFAREETHFSKQNVCEILTKKYVEKAGSSRDYTEVEIFGGVMNAGAVAFLRHVGGCKLAWAASYGGDILPSTTTSM